MKLPRDVSGADLVKALAKVGYVATRQKGSHIRLTTTIQGQHHVTVPNHESIRIGTLADIIKDVAEHLGLDRDELVDRLFK